MNNPDGDNRDDALDYETVERWIAEIKKYDLTGDESLEVIHDD